MKVPTKIPAQDRNAEENFIYALLNETLLAVDDLMSSNENPGYSVVRVSMGDGYWSVLLRQENGHIGVDEIKRVVHGS